jgi:hypothetical protein
VDPYQLNREIAVLARYLEVSLASIEDLQRSGYLPLLTDDHCLGELSCISSEQDPLSPGTENIPTNTDFVFDRFQEISFGPIAKNSIASRLVDRCRDGVLLAYFAHQLHPQHIPLHFFSSSSIALSLSSLSDHDENGEIEPSAASMECRQRRFETMSAINTFLQQLSSPPFKLTNLPSSKDIMKGDLKSILSVLWGLVRQHLLAPVSLDHYPQMIWMHPRVSAIFQMDEEQLLLAWLNYHLKRAGSVRYDYNSSLLYSIY